MTASVNTPKDRSPGPPPSCTQPGPAGFSAGRSAPFRQSHGARHPDSSAGRRPPLNTCWNHYYDRRFGSADLHRRILDVRVLLFNPRMEYGFTESDRYVRRSYFDCSFRGASGRQVSPGGLSDVDDVWGELRSHRSAKWPLPIGGLQRIWLSGVPAPYPNKAPQRVRGALPRPAPVMSHIDPHHGPSTRHHRLGAGAVGAVVVASVRTMTPATGCAHEPSRRRSDPHRVRENAS